MPPPVERYEFLGMTAVGADRAFAATIERVRRVANGPASVLIQGESGAGKEVVARAVHCFSMRFARPWVDINCGALPENLVESELFGYEKGAFSGADRAKPGMFDMAAGGTLFLDEIGELDARLQVKLLRVLDCGEFYRLGGTRKVKVDVRIVSASNSDLSKLVEQGKFRKDLYHRLAQIRIDVPPLRERRACILALAEFFREKYGIEAAFSARARAVLLAYDWPGNIRELRNLVMGLAGNEYEKEIGPEDLPPELGQGAAGRNGQDSLLSLAAKLARTGGEARGNLLASTERALVSVVLQRTNGHHEQASQILGISSRTLRRKIREWATNGPSEQAEICEGAL